MRTTSPHVNRDREGMKNSILNSGEECIGLSPTVSWIVTTSVFIAVWWTRKPGGAETLSECVFVNTNICLAQFSIKRSPQSARGKDHRPWQRPLTSEKWMFVQMDVILTNASKQSKNSLEPPTLINAGIHLKRKLSLLTRAETYCTTHQCIRGDMEALFVTSADHEGPCGGFACA